ncbi:glutathione peroxidase [Thermobifida halotolerans]
MVGAARVRLPNMKIYQSELRSLEGEPFRLPQDQLLLIVNVASKCGLTPQYSGLERLQEAYAYRGFSVVGVPCNQFGDQEPGDAGEIRLFCATTYGISFPMLEKAEVNGPDRHPLYAELTKARDSRGVAGDVQWNFEKFLVAPGGRVLGRFRPRVEPEDPEIISAIEENLPN